jgi:hypothetical protein
MTSSGFKNNGKLHLPNSKHSTSNNGAIKQQGNYFKEESMKERVSYQREKT